MTGAAIGRDYNHLWDKHDQNPRLLAARPMSSISPEAGARAGLLETTATRRWTIVGLLFTASLINYFDRATISFALPLISKELQLGPESKGLLLSAFFWSYTLMQIPMGLLADRVNLRWLYAGSFTLWSIAQGLIGFSDRPGLADRAARPARPRGVDLPAGRLEDRQPAVPAGAARAAERPVRRRHPHRAGHRGRAGAVDAGPLRLARQLLAGRLRGAALADARGSWPRRRSCARRARPRRRGRRSPWPPGPGARSPTATCWGSASGSSASTTTGTSWSTGCRTTWSPRAA